MKNSKCIIDLEKGDWPEVSNCHRPPPGHLKALGFSAKDNHFRDGPVTEKHTYSLKSESKVSRAGKTDSSQPQVM